MNKLITYIATALVPVFLTWALGYIKAPDSVDLIDYSSSGTELINSLGKLGSSLKANDKSVERLSIYNIRFANNSSRNLQKIQVEFKIKSAEGSEVVASAIKGPKNYSDSLIKKVGETKTSATYLIDFMNVATKSPGEFFTASFLFSGPPPESITPVSLTPSVEFIDAKENSKTDIIGTSIVVVFLIVYVAFIWWAIQSGKKEGKVRQEKFEQGIAAYLGTKFSLSAERTEETSKEIVALRDAIYKPENRLKKRVREWLSA